MYLSLIKKDFSIVLRQNSGIIIVQLLFILVVTSINLGIVGYGYCATAFAWHMLMTIAAKEKESHSLTLLLSMPFDKERIIRSRYYSTILGFVGISVFYEAIAVVTNALGFTFFKPIDVITLCTSFLAYALFVAITLPLYWMFEDSTVRIISIVILLGSAYIGFFLWNRASVREFLQSTLLAKDFYPVFAISVAVISLMISKSIMRYLFEQMEF